MTHLKRILLILLHLFCTAGIQLILLRLLLGASEPALGSYLGSILLSVLLCVLDLVLSMLLLRKNRMNRPFYIALQFWDILLISPVVLLAVFGLISGGEGAGFGTAALFLDLLLILERSTSFVLRDPERQSE